MPSNYLWGSSLNCTYHFYQSTLHMDITKWSDTEVRLITFFVAEDGEAVSKNKTWSCLWLTSSASQSKIQA